MANHGMGEQLRGPKSLAQTFFGRLVDRTGSFDLGFAIAGCLPLIAFLVLWGFWEKPNRAALKIAG